MDKSVKTMWETLLDYIFNKETIENLKNMTQQERDRFLREYFNINNNNKTKWARNLNY